MYATIRKGWSQPVGVVRTLSGKCRKCYSCIRNCPVKAIKVENEQSQVISARCISCGSCVKVCKQNAKRIDDGIGPALELLVSGQRVAACIAPSFPAEFHNCRPGQVFAALRSLGFDYVAEVSVGAGLIASSYLSLLKQSAEVPLISSACAAVVNVIEIYYPQLIPNLAPVVSPAVALARHIKTELGGDTRVVFIGPCLAKKAEAVSPHMLGDIDVVLTFDELRQLLSIRRVSVDQLQPGRADLLDLSDMSSLPISGGLSYALGLQGGLLNQDFITCEGPKKCLAVLDDIAAGRIYPRFADLLFCDGCIDGSGMSQNSSLHFRRHLVTSYVREKRIAYSSQDYTAYSDFLSQSSARLYLSRGFEDRSMPAYTVDEQSIEAVLSHIGKHPGKELNCGACGYDNCRDMAIAICQGRAEVRMCLQHLIDELDQANTTVLRNNEDLRRVLRMGRSINATLSIEKIVDAIESSLQQLFDCDDSSALLYDPKADKVIHSSCSLAVERLALHLVSRLGLRVEDASPLSKGAVPFSEALAHARASGYLLPDGEPDPGVCALMSPITTKGECVGILVIEKNDRDSVFQVSDYRMLELLSDYASNAIANALAYQQTLELKERLESLNELTKSVARSLDLESALRAIAENLEKVLSADVYHLSMVEGGRNYIYLSPGHISAGPSKDSLVPYPVESGHVPLLETARRSRGPVVVHYDDRMDEADKSFFAEHSLKSVLTVPIRSGDELIAIISFGYATAVKQHVLTNQYDRCEKAAEMLGLLIANARAFRDTSMELNQKTDQLEQAIAKARQAEKLALLGKMASIVAHDLRTPVSSLGMSVYGLKNRIDPAGTRYPELAILEDSVVRLKEAMENLLDFSRETRVRRRECDINALIKRIISTLGGTHGCGGARIEYRLPESMPKVSLDEAHVERAVTNLLLNAVQASQTKSGTVRVVSAFGGDEVTISVIDDGPGIPDELRQRIFEPFYTTKDKGTGLGLVVVKKVAEAHGGYVEVDSSPRGTRFTLHLPVSPVEHVNEHAQ